MPVEVDPKTGKRTWTWGVPGMGAPIELPPEGEPATPGMAEFGGTMKRLATNPEIAGFGAGLLTGGNPVMMGGAAGAMQALRDRLDGKPFDPTNVGTEVAFNMGPGVLGEAAGLKQPATTMLKGLLKKFGLGDLIDAASPLDSTAADMVTGEKWWNPVSKGTKLGTRAGATQVLKQSVNLSNASPLGNKPIADALENIAKAIQQGKPLPATAWRDLQESGMPITTAADVIRKRVTALSSGALAVKSGYEDYDALHPGGQ